MKKKLRGTIDGDHVLLDESADVPQGARATVIVETPGEIRQNEIKDRQMGWINKGFDLGKKLYLTRGELHERKTDRR